MGWSSRLGCAAVFLWAAGCSDPTFETVDAQQVPDAMHADAATADVPPSDAIAPDAGMSDAAAPDAAAPDAAAPDAAAADAMADAGPPPFQTQFELVTSAATSCVLFADGRVKCWGRVDLTVPVSYGVRPDTMGPNLAYVDFGAGVHVARLAAGQNVVCAILEGGALRCFGDNTYGELGFRGPGGLGPITPPPVDFGVGRTATAASIGWTHSCAILDDRSVSCWGANDVGELGQGTRTSTTRAHRVDLGTGHTAKAIDADGYFGCAILDDDGVKCWGANGNSATDSSLVGGQLGTGDLRARGNDPNEMGDLLPEIDFGTNPALAQRWRVRQVRTGITRTCVLLENDRVKCIGRNDNAPDVLGTGDNIGWGSTMTTIGDAIPFIDLGNNPATAQPWRVLDLDVGDSMTCVRLENERLKCWGNGIGGSIGLPGPGAIGDVPAEMGDALAFLDLGINPATAQPWRVRAVSCGKYHSCAVLEGDRVKCWGDNGNGQLGLGDQQNRGDNAGEMGDALPLVELQ